MWYTDEQLASISALARLDPSQVSAVAVATERLYGYVQTHPGITDADLRTWAESAGIPPATFNGASDILQQAGKAVHLSTLASAPAVLGGGPHGVVSRVLTSAFTAEDLKGAAKRVGAEVAASATKEEHAAGIVEAVLAS